MAATLPGSYRMPILLLTAEIPPHRSSRWADAGADDYVIKTYKLRN